MNRSHSAAAAALAVLAACTPMDRGVDAAEPRFPRLAVVNVVNGAVSVTEEPVDLFANNGAIRWGFGSNPAGYVFPADGIKFDRSPPTPPPSMGCRSFPDPDTVFKNCKPMQHGEFFQCVKTGRPVVDACFKYDIKVELPGGGSPLKLDPWVKVK